MEDNPTWVDKILQLVEESKREPKSLRLTKPKEVKPTCKEKIVLSSKEDGLLWFEMLKALSTAKSSSLIYFWEILLIYPSKTFQNKIRLPLRQWWSIREGLLFQGIP